MNQPDGNDSQHLDGADGSISLRRSGRKRTIVAIVFVVAVVAAAAYTIIAERRSLGAAFDRMGPLPVLGAFAAGTAGVFATFLSWREVLGGLGAEIPVKAGARVFFVTQLGKYLPGSVWPALMQMEAGRAYGAPRRTMLGANLVVIVVGCATGLVVASALLPLHGSDALRHYWWVFLALPVLLGLLHPRALPALLDLAFRAVRQPPLGQRLDPMTELKGSAWYVVSWAAFGLQICILSSASTPLKLSDWSTYALSTGGIALAVAAGVLVLPAPAGAGIREVVLGLVLATVMPTGAAVAVVLTSRALFTVTDLALAGIDSLIRSPASRMDETPPGTGPRLTP